MSLGYTAPGDAPQRSPENLMLYRGTQNRPRRAHLIFQDEDTTLCNMVDADRTQKGELDGNKAFEFKGLDHVLGHTCQHCKEIYKEEIKP